MQGGRAWYISHKTASRAPTKTCLIHRCKFVLAPSASPFHFWYSSLWRSALAPCLGHCSGCTRTSLMVFAPPPSTRSRQLFHEPLISAVMEMILRPHPCEIAAIQSQISRLRIGILSKFESGRCYETVQNQPPATSIPYRQLVAQVLRVVGL